MIDWHEIEPGTYEARVGDWLLEVGCHDEGPWIVWVGLLSEREKRRATVPSGGTIYRRSLSGSLDEAQRAAVALAVEKCAPFVATARAEAAAAEREACAAIADERSRWACDSLGAALAARGVSDDIAAAIRARGTQHATPDGIDNAAGQALR